ncbi:UNVERIFIED_CONTAM: hypothetical protein RMT77_012975 [Armadillidium vulgare]
MKSNIHSKSGWLKDTSILLAIIAACLFVFGSITSAIFFKRRTVTNANEDNKGKIEPTIVTENPPPMNGTATLIRRKSMNTLEAYLPSSGETPSYYTFEMDAPPPSPINSIKDGTLSGASIYSYKGRRKNSSSLDYATISSKTSEKLYTFSNC